MTKLENPQCQFLYNNKCIPNSGNLYLIIDAISVDISVNLNNATWELTAPDNRTDYVLQALSFDTLIPLTLELVLNENSGTFVVATQQPLQRLVIPVASQSQTSMPLFDLPNPLAIDVANNTWKNKPALNPDSWMYPPFHIDYAFSEPVQNSSSVQISLAFMLVVVICNALKVAVIYRTLKMPLSSQVLTLGDGMYSFLERPDSTTLGFCAFETRNIEKHLRHPIDGDAKSCEYHRRFVENSTRERWASSMFIWSAAVIAFFTMVVAILLTRPAMTDEEVPNKWDWNWATSSTQQIPTAQSAFGTGGILFNAWLANAPQLVLSMAYFALNRMFTSIYFIREWNSYYFAKDSA